MNNKYSMPDFTKIYTATKKLQNCLKEVNQIFGSFVKSHFEQQHKKLQKFSSSDEQVEIPYKTKQKQRNKMDICMIKKPLTPFNKFGMQYRPLIKKKYPNSEGNQVSRILGRLWGELTREEKQIYESVYQKQLQEYSHKIEEWKNKTKNENKQQSTVLQSNSIRKTRKQHEQFVARKACLPASKRDHCRSIESNHVKYNESDNDSSNCSNDQFSEKGREDSGQS